METAFLAFGDRSLRDVIPQKQWNTKSFCNLSQRISEDRIASAILRHSTVIWHLSSLLHLLRLHMKVASIWLRKRRLSITFLKFLSSSILDMTLLLFPPYYPILQFTLYYIVNILASYAINLPFLNSFNQFISVFFSACFILIFNSSSI